MRPAGERAPEWPDADFGPEHASGRSGSDSVPGQEAYGGTPAHGTPVRPAGEHAPEWPDADFGPEHASGRSGSDSVPGQ
ncbi:hypothetical protein, partial [Streptomyces sp. NRRL F-2305]|uniref:hypothetical protein n=1 Tax=Streptomyces sp. NRRL F-2305 TaxID=1463840 RepID=UPI001F2BAC5D